MRFWHRPVHTKDLILLLAVAALSWLMIVAVTLFFAWPKLGFRVDLHDQRLNLRIPANMQGAGIVRSQIPLQLKFDKEINIPINQPVQVKIDNAIPARAKLSVMVPVHTEVVLQQSIPVETVLHMMVPVRSWLPPVPASLPVKMSVPVNIRVPIDVKFPFSIDDLAVATMPEPMQVPLKLNLKSVARVNQPVMVGVTGAAEFSLLTPLDKIPVRIETASLTFSLADLGWELAN